MYIHHSSIEEFYDSLQSLSHQTEIPPSTPTTPPSKSSTTPSSQLQSPDGGSPMYIHHSSIEEFYDSLQSLSHQTEVPPSTPTTPPSKSSTTPSSQLQSPDGGSSMYTHHSSIEEFYDSLQSVTVTRRRLLHVHPPLLHRRVLGLLPVSSDKRHAPGTRCSTIRRVRHRGGRGNRHF